MTILTGMMAATLLTGCGDETDTVINNQMDMEPSVMNESETEIAGPELTDTYDFAINGKVYNLPLTCGELFGEGSEVSSNDSIVQNSASYQRGDKSGGNANPYNYASNSNASTLAKNVVNSIITGNMSDLEKAKAIHDWMVMNLDYDYQNYLIDIIPSTSWQVEGVLTTKYAICEGYARTFIDPSYQGTENIYSASTIE